MLAGFGCMQRDLHAEAADETSIHESHVVHNISPAAWAHLA